MALGVLAVLGAQAVALAGGMQPVSAQPISSSDSQARAADAKVVASAEAPADAISARAPTRKPASASEKGPYYVDFRARTAASWGHAFVWYGKTSERAVDVAGLTPAGDTGSYVLGYLTWVPSETGASYGDLDPQYLTAPLQGLPERDRRQARLRLHQAPAGEFAAVERRDHQLHELYRRDRRVHGIEDPVALDPAGGLRQPPQGAQQRPTGRAAVGKIGQGSTPAT